MQLKGKCFWKEGLDRPELNPFVFSKRKGVRSMGKKTVVRKGGRGGGGAYEILTAACTTDGVRKSLQSCLDLIGLIYLIEVK